MENIICKSGRYPWGYPLGSTEIKLDTMHPSCIRHHILENVEDSKEYLYLIMGPIGMRTGKTWLCNVLKMHDYNAIEITEELCEYVIYRDRKNHFYVNTDKKLVIIVLNELLD